MPTRLFATVWLAQQLPHAPGIVPELLDRVLPVHQVVPVDIDMPGCPSAADRIKATLEPLLKGELPHMVGRDLIKCGRSIAESILIERNE